MQFGYETTCNMPSLHRVWFKLFYTMSLTKCLFNIVVYIMTPQNGACIYKTDTYVCMLTSWMTKQLYVWRLSRVSRNISRTAWLLNGWCAAEPEINGLCLPSDCAERRSDVPGVVVSMWGNEIFPAQVHFDLILSPPKEFFHIFAGRSDRFFDYDVSADVQ